MIILKNRYFLREKHSPLDALASSEGDFLPLRAEIEIVSSDPSRLFSGKRQKHASVKPQKTSTGYFNQFLFPIFEIFAFDVIKFLTYSGLGVSRCDIIA